MPGWPLQPDFNSHEHLARQEMESGKLFSKFASWGNSDAGGDKAILDFVDRFKISLGRDNTTEIAIGAAPPRTCPSCPCHKIQAFCTNDYQNCERRTMLVILLWP